MNRKGLTEILEVSRYDKSVCTTKKGIQLKRDYQYIQSFKTINQSLMNKLMKNVRAEVLA